ncbi:MULTISPECIES: TetR/AcrR family transcriptional regulator [unclassified Janthinobacterium]|uniref:TetR/AcrR family transcriptional regulator n=1 Tax=unclassified Janthinobacterium TaxID=2610881 RepID=UPI00161B65DB|nr:MULTISPECIES: TetR/AcrR family transcriptional regulator [unclassified Janthinobacterium]MBB5368810.1 TetR/AcrR family transcriptional repressor of nem operon [Janthinobacterium sp. K2C7]MBB5381654.1 TetR/AcrR family transcriptional repressor of nem operon [Janthinobacterium sp. K2Li3]MBB5387192.1 TetR/AcrR family transcriptional repressor of nem operon [Janthinobacterium sp. K2E3]
MKVSREQAALNRERIVEVAAKLFREKGYDGIGVADLMKNAGLTHGGFYGHFASKEDLMVEACELALKKSLESWKVRIEQDPQQALPKLVNHYLSTQSRDTPGVACPAPTMGVDVARSSPSARPAFTATTRQQFDLLAGLMPEGTAEEKRRLAITTFSALVGAMVLARSTDDAAFSEEIMEAVRTQLLAS